MLGDMGPRLEGPGTMPALSACSRVLEQSRDVRGEKVNFAGSVQEGVTAGLPLVAGAG